MGTLALTRKELEEVLDAIAAQKACRAGLSPDPKLVHDEGEPRKSTG